MASVALITALVAGPVQGCTSSTSSTGDPPPLRVGVLVDCVGFFRNLQDASLAGAEIPLLTRGASLRGPLPSDGVTAAIVAGRPVELVTGCTEASEYSTLIEQARLLVEVDHVDVVIGGTWPGDGLVLGDVARRYPGTSFVIVGAGPREATLPGTVSNLFRFAPDLSQQAAGLGTYAFTELGWRNAVVIAEDDEVGWGGAAAFLAEFCALGGRASQFLLAWDPAAPSPAAAVHSADGVAVFLTPFGRTPDKLAALAAGRKPLATSLVLGPGVSYTLEYLRALPRSLRGVVTAVPAPGADTTREQYRTAYTRNFPGLAEREAMQPSVVAYHDAVEAVMRALEQSGGTVGTGGAALRQALGSLDTDLVAGRVRLDGNRAAVVSTALTRLAGDGSEKLIQTVPDVDQTIGGALPSTYQPTSGEQPCRAGPAPPWAR